MSWRTENEAEWDGEDWRDDQSVEQPDDDDESTAPCPYCRRETYDDAPQCPHCGQYISEEAAPAVRKPWWIIVGVLLCFCVIWLWLGL
jgi:hypothetical protein